MWKREKIGSTSRIGTDNILPFMKFEGTAITHIVSELKKLVKQVDVTQHHTQIQWLLDNGFKVPSQTDKATPFLGDEISNIKINVIASSKEIDHLPSKWLK